MIELSDADFQYDGEDITGVAIAQVVSLVAAVSAVIMLASYNVGIVDGFGAPPENCLFGGSWSCTSGGCACRGGSYPNPVQPRLEQ